MAAAMHHSAHRLSLEWSRIEPEQGKWDEAVIAHYQDELQWLRGRGIKTFVTLHHFTNPLWVARMRGWENRKTITHFADFVAKVCQSIGHLVDFWVTINEPGVYAAMGYVRGKFPPFKKNYLRALRVYRNMLRGHNSAYKMIHAYYPDARVGFAHNIAFNEKKSRWRNFLAVDWPYRHTKNDFIGLNQYFYKGRKKVPLTDRGWAIHPAALYEVLMDLRRFHLPIYITENGLADAKDEKRTDYIRGYLAAAHRAISHGSNLRGYLHWSLLDNFEWEDGYKWKFGLVEVDFKTQKRKIRPSARYYSEICQNNQLTLSS